MIATARKTTAKSESEKGTRMLHMMDEMGMRAKAASQALRSIPAESVANALVAAAAELRFSQAMILAANDEDVSKAKSKGLSGAMVDRLLLDEPRIEAVAKSLEAIAAMPDPNGRTLAEWEQPNGLRIKRVSVPLGVIGIIYESRPNVTADAAAICLKSGNAAILRCGSESFHSSKAIMNCLIAGFMSAKIPEHTIQLVPTTDRAAVGEMLTMRDYIDIIIPRGGKALTERIAKESRIPTIQHLDGNCHIYVHESANPAKTVAVIENAKLRRTGICGAVESLVIDDSIVETILPTIVDTLHERGCEIRGDAAACASDDRIKKASDSDWGTEYLDAIISVKTISGMNEALSHIERYSSHHTDAIITEDEDAAARFTQAVDSAIVMVNTSTQFADGGEFGMGAEIGISTGRLHARGPVGCQQLTTYKYVVDSDGATRE